jgi:hypothetical protein
MSSAGIPPVLLVLDVGWDDEPEPMAPLEEAVDASGSSANDDEEAPLLEEALLQGGDGSCQQAAVVPRNMTMQQHRGSFMGRTLPLPWGCGHKTRMWAGNATPAFQGHVI